jgi:hypothetical protein
MKSSYFDASIQVFARPNSTRSGRRSDCDMVTVDRHSVLLTLSAPRCTPIDLIEISFCRRCAFTSWGKVSKCIEADDGALSWQLNEVVGHSTTAS